MSRLRYRGWPKTSPAYDDARANAFQFDLDKGFWLGGGSFAQLDPGTAFTKSRALSVTGNISAFTAPVNGAAVDLVGRATTEIVPTRRKQFYADLNKVYIIGMSPTTNRLMATTKVHGIAPTLHSAQKWWEAWLA